MTSEQIKTLRYKHLGIVGEDRASEKAFKFKKCSCGKDMYFFRKMCDECLNKLLEPILKLR